MAPWVEKLIAEVFVVACIGLALWAAANAGKNVGMAEAAALCKAAGTFTANGVTIHCAEIETTTLGEYLARERGDG